MASESGILTLSHGETFYVIDGENSGIPLFMIHGATVPHWEFDEIVPHLTKAGYRTLRFDLLGHGESARPKLEYGIDVFVQQAVELLETVASQGLFCVPRFIIGHSMGAAIASRVVPKLRGSFSFEGIVLMAPLLDFSSINPFRHVLKRPLVARPFMRWVGLPLLVRRRHRRYHAIGLPQLSDRFKDQARRPGFWQALLSMEQSGAMGDQREGYRAFGSIEDAPPVRVLWGNQDPIIPRADVEHIVSMLPTASLEVMEGLAHNLMLACPQRVASAIHQFFRVSSAT